MNDQADVGAVVETEVLVCVEMEAWGLSVPLPPTLAEPVFLPGPSPALLGRELSFCLAVAPSASSCSQAEGLRFNPRHLQFGSRILGTREMMLYDFDPGKVLLAIVGSLLFLTLSALPCPPGCKCKPLNLRGPL